MNIPTLLDTYAINRPLIIGYYGGTNYGDELLLEVLQQLLAAKNIGKATVYYSNDSLYSTYHHEFGNKRISSKWQLAKALMGSKHIIIGGGGIWGVDVNVNVFILSLLLFLAGTILHKNIYLVSIGYYNSTNSLGHVSAWLVGKAATAILSRDSETYKNFAAYSSQLFLDQDLSLYIPSLSLTEYAKEAEEISQHLHLSEKRTLIGLRRFRKGLQNDYTKHAIRLIRECPEKAFTLVIFESKVVAPEAYALIQETASALPNCIGADFSCNPLALYLALHTHRSNLSVIAPQYHVQITAFANGIPFLPLAYDAKNREFFKSQHISHITEASAVTYEDLLAYIRQ